MARRSDNRGFASMDPERRRRLASEGSRSRGGRDRDYEDEYDEGYDEDYDDEEQGVSSRYEDLDYDDDYNDDEDEYENTGYGDEDEYEYENEGDFARGRPGRRSSTGDRRSSSATSGRRGFSRMNPERQRRAARMGGEVTSRTRGLDFYEETGHGGRENVRDEYGPDSYSRMGRRGGQARWEADEDDRGRGRARGRTSSGRNEGGSGRSGRSSGGGMSSGNRRTSSSARSSSERSSSGRRGFGAMSREEARRIASKGGRARWGEEENDRGRGRNSSSRGRSRGR